MTVHCPRPLPLFTPAAETIFRLSARLDLPHVPLPRKYRQNCDPPPDPYVKDPYLHQSHTANMSVASSTSDIDNHSTFHRLLELRRVKAKGAWRGQKHLGGIIIGIHSRKHAGGDSALRGGAASNNSSA